MNVHDQRDEGHRREASDPAASRVPPSQQRQHDHETVLDEVAERLGFRDVIRQHRWIDTVYRGAVGVIGFAIMIAGFGLIPLPGPGWLIVFLGLGVLATEFAWAERLLDYGRGKLRSWTDWVKRQSLAVRAAIGLAGLLLIGGLLGLYLRLQGVPDWIPVIG